MKRQYLPVPRALALNGNDATAWYIKGVCLDELGRSKEAQEAYGKSLELEIILDIEKEKKRSGYRSGNYSEGPVTLTASGTGELFMVSMDLRHGYPSLVLRYLVFKPSRAAGTVIPGLAGFAGHFIR